jgi:hypothetical protein
VSSYVFAKKSTDLESRSLCASSVRARDFGSL